MTESVYDFSAIAEALEPYTQELAYRFSNGRKFYAEEGYSAPTISSVTGLPISVPYYIGLGGWE